MAESLAHRFGQIIGEVLEAAVLPLLTSFATTHKLYLDQKGPRPCRGAGLKCTWVDGKGNKHDLDFVLERGGAPNKQGVPVAFIETAWRRYTKHSKNKAQEIQGAVQPLADKFSSVSPFKGAILAGEFTNGALTQLRSLGFQVVFFPYHVVVGVFSKLGIDAGFGEGTEETEFAKKIKQYESLSPAKKTELAKELLHANKTEMDLFMKALSDTVLRQVKEIIILPLHGKEAVLKTAKEAISFVESYKQEGSGNPFQRYEVIIRYNNGNEVDGKFIDKESTVTFLKTLAPEG